MNKPASSLERGIQVISRAVKKLPNSPGVYRMVDAQGDALYVGKAKALRKRVQNYTHVSRLPIRLQRMVAATHSMEFIHTHTEAEALLLESNLIKKLKPKYNILLRDDKSFPYILVTGDHDFPMVKKHRGAKKPKGEYFGPFAGTGDVNRTIDLLQRIFLLRNCSDNVFANRTRPCLQYHIKRCTAPCVDLVGKEQYAMQVKEARDFLNGKSRQVQARMTKAMRNASAEMDYESAALYRDRIKALSSISARQDINIEGLGNADVFGMVQDGGRTCVQVFFFRNGRNYGNRAYFPRVHEEDQPHAILAAFLAQFYENKPIPKTIIAGHDLEDKVLLEDAFSLRADRAVKIVHPKRGQKLKLLQFAERNAGAALQRDQTRRFSEEKYLAALESLFALDEPPKRIEVYDNSHISGTNMVGGMIVAGPEGFRKNAYRKFNIRTAKPGDDYGMMREVLERRFKRALKEQAKDSEWPDIVLIDGGLGQYNAVREVLEECGVFEQVCLVAIAKGEDRDAGRETFFMAGRKPFTLPFDDLTLHYLQRLRDEAHRFVIGAHRTRRKKAISDSPLDEISGVGPKIKQALLYHFGSAKAVARAGVEDLEKVPGVSKSKATVIYDHFHENV